MVADDGQLTNVGEDLLALGCLVLLAGLRFEA